MLCIDAVVSISTCSTFNTHSRPTQRRQLFTSTTRSDVFNFSMILQTSRAV
ncbi:uncharacterized protein LACBIDRAFT_316552 [Laccaria bicolor S238N-H82]|uniref:Predicted protein n=1 Tax=Laccaria bicolor (strain S238N-H82 / ATCC MYA-4686) TaxID=486041 RepID=B0E562_LACBS|nr:uncharacterized protein LACBIDRAFT_316552 [Laccaria bicolor S238N-H82]EDQ98019.1 predicted protein [Laccaria bicolor S238N-H82]|eukprot:XP_001891330.1 predicted protein [Laccaria bicolor S238N-H82]